MNHVAGIGLRSDDKPIRLESSECGLNRQPGSAWSLFSRLMLRQRCFFKNSLNRRPLGWAGWCLAARAIQRQLNLHVASVGFSKKMVYAFAILLVYSPYGFHNQWSWFTLHENGVGLLHENGVGLLHKDGVGLNLKENKEGRWRMISLVFLALVSWVLRCDQQQADNVIENPCSSRTVFY